jgi:hypothetical protein
MQEFSVAKIRMCQSSQYEKVSKKAWPETNLGENSSGVLV